jgi:predicted glycoside hydrolase/deacetylase ChbG (UPF0249 family)
VAHGADKTMAGLPESLMGPIVEYAPKLLEEFQPRRPDAFFASFYDELATREELLRIINSLPKEGTFEIMCHPGYVDEAFAKESGYAFQRHAELDVLTDPAMHAEIEKCGIELISFAQL